jgi:hypothetical protein
MPIVVVVNCEQTLSLKENSYFVRRRELRQIIEVTCQDPGRPLVPHHYPLWSVLKLSDNDDLAPT